MADDTPPLATDQAEAEPAPDQVQLASEPRPIRRLSLTFALIAGTTLLLWTSFFFIEPLIKLITEPQRRLSLVQPDWPLVIEQRLLEALTSAWFFMLGASLGSFLHCLEYRWPRGISVVARGSACPGCGTPIHLWHNVPVFGWLGLRGRCARCGWEIPARYAITELTYGATFVLLMWVELIGGGVNLPGVDSGHYFGVIENIWSPNWRLIGIFTYHAALLTFLLSFSLFAWDRFGLPLRIAAVAILLGIAWPLLWPASQVVGWDDLPNSDGGSRLRIACGQVAGAVAGLLLGNCLVRRRPGNIRAGDVATTLVGMLLVGLYLGWQAALAIAALIVLARTILSFTTARTWPVVASMILATLIHLIAWRWLMQLPVYPALHDRWPATLAAVIVVPIASALIDSIERGGDAGPTIVDRQLTIAPAAEIESISTADDSVVDESSESSSPPLTP